MNFRRTVFPNGLVLVTERPKYKGVQGLSIGLFVRLGSRFEERSRVGVSHFIEHMLFKGTKDRTAIDIVREIEDRGGDFNAFTDREYTCYHVLVLKSQAAVAAEVLSDIVLNSVFDAEEIERERKVILQEIAMVDESPEELAYDVFFQKIYGRHGLGHNIIGSQNSIRNLKRSHILRYYREYYRPDQMIISVCGDVPHAQMVKLFRPLARMKLKKQNRKKLLAAPPIRQGKWWSEQDSEQAHIVVGYPSSRLSSKDRYVVGLLNAYLGGGMSSLLFQEIREKNGLAYSVYSYVYPFIDSGVFTIYAGTGIHQINRCLGLIENCVEKVSKDLLSRSELQAVKSSLKGNILLLSDDVEARMLSVGRNEMFLSAYVSPNQVCKMIDMVTAKDIRRVARKLFFSKNATKSTLVLSPKTKQKRLFLKK